MRGLRKYLAIIFILLVYPMAHFIAGHFIVGDDNSAYQFVPEDSDVVIEINTRNFMREVIYQKVFNEDYFNEKLFPPDKLPDERPDINIGIDFFSKIILFREIWSEEKIWIAVVPYNDRTLVGNFMEGLPNEPAVAFNDKFAFVQLNRTSQKDALIAHLQDVSAGKVKSFATRVDLSKAFDPSKEVNVYMINQSSDDQSKLIEGYLNFDFLKDEIRIDGEFIPVSGLETEPAIAYQANDRVAVCLRSSLDLFNSIYWFTNEKIDSVPRYNQVALDYTGINIFLCDPALGYDFPFKTYPDVQLQFDITEPWEWDRFISRLENSGQIKVDTSGHLIATRQGTFFQYELTGQHFKLMRGINALFPSDENRTYFSLRADLEALLENCKFQIDEANPPPAALQTFGLLAASEMIGELKAMATMASFEFTMSMNEDLKLIAEGHGKMKNPEGHSLIESIVFGMMARDFGTAYLSKPLEASENKTPF